MNAEQFLQKYRILEGLLERRYDGQKLTSSSVIMHYLRDPDSAPVRTDLDLCREIRNILSHNANPDGGAVVQPSDAMIEKLEKIIDFVRRPRRACEFGTPADQILCAHPNDNIRNVMRSMRKNGYSHVPVMDQRGLVGVFSMRSLFNYLAENGLESLDSAARISQLGDELSIDGKLGKRYLFVSKDASVHSVRMAFQNHSERNNRLGLVFVTETGTADESIICMLTPWDVLNDQTR